MESEKLNSASYCNDVCYMQFQPNKGLGKVNKDNGFLRYRLKLSKPQSNSKINREVLTTFLTSIQGDSDAMKAEFAEIFTDRDIHYGDLASLTQEDLQLLGFKNAKEGTDLLKFFSQLPNQDASYDNICHLKEAVTYNNQMAMCVSKHFVPMRSIIAAANYKLQIMPSNDTIMDEKSFASHLVVDAVNELIYITDHIQKDVERLKFAAKNKQQYFHRTIKLNLNDTFLIVGRSICCISALLAVYNWKFKN